MDVEAELVMARLSLDRLREHVRYLPSQQHEALRELALVVESLYSIVKDFAKELEQRQAP